MSRLLQQFIYMLTFGPGARVFRVLLALIAVGTLGGLYDATVYRNFSNREAMDMAQLGKNLSEGRGYTTLFVRPFSMFLVQRHRPDHSPEIKTQHPDTANPPVYPTLLAGLFKLVPARRFAAPAPGSFIYAPDLAVAVLNQVLLVLAAVLLYFLAKTLLDEKMAWVTTAVFLGAEMMWRFSVSGLSTILLVVLFLALAWCLVVLEHSARLARPDAWLVALAGLAGALVGAGGLTRYSYAWMILAVLGYLLAFFNRNRAALALAALGGFLVVMGPWVVRNYAVSGMPFGTATFTICQETGNFTEDRLERSLSPDLRTVTVPEFGRKLIRNSREVFENMPKLGGSWVPAFFLVGLVLPFRSAALARLRWFLLFSLVALGVAQTLGHTALSVESPEINSENLVVLVVPLVFMYGVALFFLLLDYLALPFRTARPVFMAGFCLIVSLPLVQSLLPPHPSPVVYPPYDPALIQRVGGWFNEKELLMSDMPWAMAWYGRRQTLWMTLNWKKDFVEITDFQKPIKGIYLTPVTMDTKFLSNWVKGQNNSWTTFLLETMLAGQVPKGFPLHQAPEGWFREGQLLLTDYDRWNLKP